MIGAIRKLELGVVVGVVGLALAGCSAGTAAPGSTSATASPAVEPSTAAASPAAPGSGLVIVTPVPGAPDSGVTIELVAKDTKWSLSTINAPAGKIWHVHIDDQDPATCNCDKYTFTVSSGPDFRQRIFTSPRFGAGAQTFDIPALPAGTYTFACTTHPNTMTGVLIVS